MGNTRIFYSTALVGCGSEGGVVPEYTLEAVMDYFPYGKILREYIKTSEKYVTTGHERDTETGLDYRGARFYDSDVARFLSLDPLVVEFPTWSDYNYVLGNPVMLIDPDGKAPEPPSIQQMFKQLSKSKTFRKLAKKANVNSDNLSSVVKWDIAGTNVGNGQISLNINSDDPMNGFTHEISNRAQFGEIQQAMFDVQYGEDNVNQYLNKIANIEGESFANQVIVLAESGLETTDPYLSKVVPLYKEGEFTKNDVKNFAVRGILNGSIVDETGTSLLRQYSAQGEALNKTGKARKEAIRKRKGEKGVKKLVKSAEKKMKKRVKDVLD